MDKAAKHSASRTCGQAWAMTLMTANAEDDNTYPGTEDNAIFGKTTAMYGASSNHFPLRAPKVFFFVYRSAASNLACPTALAVVLPRWTAPGFLPPHSHGWPAAARRDSGMGDLVVFGRRVVQTL